MVVAPWRSSTMSLLETLGINALSTEERALLAHDIWHTIERDAEEMPLSDELKLELDRRWAAFQANPETAIPWEQIKAEAARRTAR